MGFELNRIMQQYGVGTPGRINYSGATAVDPGARPVASDTLSGEALTKAQADHDALVTKYQLDQKNQPLDTAAYDAYSKEYQTRLQNTPMYMQSQFQTGYEPKSSGLQYAQDTIGLKQYNKNIQDYVAQNPNAYSTDINAIADKYGVSGQDIYNATQNRWGNVLRAPTYGTYKPPVSTVVGGGGNDKVVIDTVVGGGGKDLTSIVGGGGNDLVTLVGGLGNDTLVGGDTNDTIVGGGTNDTIVGGGTNDTIVGGGTNDTLVGGGTNDTLIGGDGNDLTTIVGGLGNDTLVGGDKNDVSVLDAEGDDTIFGGTKVDTIVGGLGNDTVIGGTGNDTVVGGLGNDTLVGGDKNDVSVLDAAGDDTIFGGGGKDTVIGGTGNDTVIGGTGNDVIYDDGTTGSILDTISTITGGAGNDSVVGALGNDVINNLNDKYDVGSGPYDYIGAVREGLDIFDRGIGDGTYGYDPFGGNDYFGGGGGLACPAPWVNIKLADGSAVKAGDIQVGMRVYTRHENKDEWGVYPVTAVEMGEDQRWEVILEDGRKFVGTFNHRVRTDADWVEIRNLNAGDKLVQEEGFGVVKSSLPADYGPVVKITVDDAHTYMTEGFLSHNIKINEAAAGGGGGGGGGKYLDLYDASAYAKGGPVKTHYQTAGRVQLPSGYDSPESEADWMSRWESQRVPVQTSPVDMTSPPPPVMLSPAEVEPAPVKAPLTAVALNNARNNAMPEAPAVVAAPKLPPVAPPAFGSERMGNIQALLAAYGPKDGAYGEELKAARATSKAESEAFAKLLSDSMKSPEDAQSSKAEMYFRLAAAFGAPTKTGHFAENLGMVGKELGDYSKEQRASRQQKLALALKGQEMKMGAAKDDLRTLQALSAEEMKDKRTIATELIKDYIKSGEPQSTAGKQALDEGLKPGTPEYQKRVETIGNMNIEGKMAQITAALANMGTAQANLALSQEKFQNQKQQQAKLSPQELKLKTETEDLLAASDSGLKALSQAYRLNPNTFDNSVLDLAQRKALEAAGSKDPKVINTREMENLLTEKALSSLKAAFGGNPTEGERKIMLDVQGIGAKSVEERARIMKSAYAAMKTARDRQNKRLNEINQGLYRETTPAPADGGIE